MRDPPFNSNPHIGIYWLVVSNILFFHILGVIIPTDLNSMIFQRGRYTTNQYIYIPFFYTERVAYPQRMLDCPGLLADMKHLVVMPWDLLILPMAMAGSWMIFMLNPAGNLRIICCYPLVMTNIAMV